MLSKKTPQRYKINLYKWQKNLLNGKKALILKKYLIFAKKFIFFKKMKGTFDFLFKLIKFNLKIIFAGKFVWFLFAALAIFILFMVQAAWDPSELGEQAVYGIMIFPALLLVFYPTVFGIQNDEDERMLELIFGIPDYRYKVWGFRILMIFAAVFVILVAFSWLANFLLCPVEPLKLSVQLLFPALFFGALAFMFSTITHSGNGTAVILIIICLLPLFFNNMIAETLWNVYLNPFNKPETMHPVIWSSLIVKNRIFMLLAGVIFLMIGLLNLQNREKFI
jgi:hypothetical protein